MDTTPGHLSAEQIIAAINNLNLRELERVFDHVLAAQAERRASHLSAKESALLARISEGLPPELRSRLSVLRARREDGSITDGEYEELTGLTDRAEELHAERMTALVELARLRGLSLPALMDQLGLHLPEHV